MHACFADSRVQEGRQKLAPVVESISNQALGDTMPNQALYSSLPQYNYSLDRLYLSPKCERQTEQLDAQSGQMSNLLWGLPQNRYFWWCPQSYWVSVSEQHYPILTRNQIQVSGQSQWTRPGIWPISAWVNQSSLSCCWAPKLQTLMEESGINSLPRKRDSQFCTHWQQTQEGSRLCLLMRQPSNKPYGLYGSTSHEQQRIW